MAIALDDMPTENEAVAVDRRPGLPFSFTGRAGEYFGIWIVNILLSIVTLGIYSAWAKVRNKRYFYGNTVLDGSSFNYLASPIQILIGRLIVFFFTVVYITLSTFNPIVGLVLLFLGFLLTPWAVVRSYRFNARNSSYRNVRFNFTGRLWESFLIYVLLPILTPFTLGLLVPYNAYLMKRFQIDKAQYGRTDFHFDGKVRSFFRIYLTTLLFFLPIVATIIAGIAAWLYAYLFMLPPDVNASGDPDLIRMHTMQAVTLAFGAYFAWLPIVLTAAPILAIIGYSYLTTALQNYAFNNARLGEHRLYLDLNLWQVLWIRFSNLVVIALSIGLMIPWARIRMARYQIERMSLIPSGDLETLVSEEQAKLSALGDELGEGMDLDLGLGV